MKVKLIFCWLSIACTVNIVSGCLPNIASGLLGGLTGRTTEPEVGKTVPEVIEYYGYPAETHPVVTEDGYIVTLHRIPHGKNGAAPKKCPPVLLQHGLLCSSAAWIWDTPERSLGFILADSGYDVWMGNYRGNEYSKNHTTLSTESEEYWKFSFDEMGKYDMPAWIDYILGKTGCTKIWLIGHSMGATGPIAMLSTIPEYNEKVELLSALAPGVTVGHMKSPLRLFAPISNPGGTFLSALDKGEFDLDSNLSDELIELVCTFDLLGSLVCANAVFAIVGPECGQLNRSRVDYYLTVFPSPTSTQTIVHFGQLVHSGKFTHYDYSYENETMNMIKYNQTTPPEYDLTKITTPVALFWGPNDWLVAPEDIAEIPPKIKNLTLNHEVNDSCFSHMDFVWAKDAKMLVYNQVIESFEAFHNKMSP